MASEGELVEVQATGERSTFPRTGLDGMLDLANIGVQRMFEATREMLDAEG